MTGNKMTIGRLAKSANVGVETIRYYQQRGLMPTPEPIGAYRYYSEDMADQLRFIKRAQELGFTLDEVGDLLALSSGSDHISIRQLAQERLAQIEAKLSDLNRMKVALSGLITACKHASEDEPCPIVKALSAK